jgi:cholesterol oxidase
MKMNAEKFDVIVVGSGFGGAVMAYRLAEAGMRVCVLERGKAYSPGSFPRTPREMKTNFWDPSEGLHGLYNVWSFRGLGAVVASGLGGGSLIYANVLLRKDEPWFVDEEPGRGGYRRWPVDRAALDPHYDRVEAMLGAQRFPLDHAPYAATEKTIALKRAAADLGLSFSLPHLAVTFANPGAPPAPGEPIPEPSPNLHGRRRYTCTPCGECCIGCNTGSKNTLDLTYLSAARRLGAEIRTRCEVRSFAPREKGGYVVRYVEHHPSREGQKTDTRRLPSTEITADYLVLSAGTLGTTHLMLKNAAAFPRLGAALGTRFSGNGDLLTFLRARRPEGGGEPVRFNPTKGPVITSAIRVPDTLDGGSGRGFYIQDAGIPLFAAWMLRGLSGPPLWGRLLQSAFRSAKGWLGLTADSDIGAEMAAILGGEDLSESAMPLLAMGRDVPDGAMRLRGDKLDVDWSMDRSRGLFQRMLDVERRIAAALGAELHENPTLFAKRLLTVHPLGGCPMGRDVSEGVVGPFGEVFRYPGLFIADGSVMPGPVGPNPALTIAALSDRFADKIIDDRQRLRRSARTAPIPAAIALECAPL